jgi:hypothetical protein
MAYHLMGSSLTSICEKIFVIPPLSQLVKADTEKAQFLVLNKIKQEIEGVTHITCKDVERSYNYPRRKECVNLKITISSLHDHIYNLSFELNFNEDKQLIIDVDRYKKYFFREVSQLAEFREAIQKIAQVTGKRHAISDGEALKRDKIKDLKKKAIIAKVLELTQLENVPYIIDDSFTTKIVIFIRLSETVRLEVNVPYNNYQIVLQNTQAAIQAVREFADKGIAINVRTSGATTPFYKWQKPN